MDEINDVVSTEETTDDVSTESDVETAETGSSDSSISDIIKNTFASDGLDYIASNEDSSEADQQTEDSGEDSVSSNDVSKPSEDHTTYELKRQGEKKSVTLEEMKAMAQQHWDYPHVREERDMAKAKAAFYEQTFENSKGEWADIWGLIDDCNAHALIKNEAKNGRVMSYEEAVANVKANREAIFKPKTVQDLENEEFEGVKNKDIALLQKRFPDIDFNKDGAISQDVWQKFRENGGNLTASYMQSIIEQKDAEIANLKHELESVEQNVKNKLRSSGSSKSAGTRQTSMSDVIKAAFKEDLY